MIRTKKYKQTKVNGIKLLIYGNVNNQLIIVFWYTFAEIITCHLIPLINFHGLYFKIYFNKLAMVA